MSKVLPLRIAILSYRLPFPGQKRGGVDQVAHDLAEGLTRRGHQVDVWSYDPPPAGASYSVRMLPGKRFFESWLGCRLTLGYLGNLIALLPHYGGVDAVIAMGDSLLLPLRHRRVIRVMHGSALGEALSARSVYRFVSQVGVFVQEVLSAATLQHCVGVSENTRRHNPFVRKIIPNGVDLSHFHPDLAQKTPEPSLLFVGTLDGRKRGRLLIEWFTEHVRSNYPNAELHMVSQVGPDVPGVRYYTGISTEEIASLYRRAWIYASPSVYEGFGLPYVEAMASGTPVVASPNPGSAEVLQGGRSGMIVEDAEFAPTLIRLLGDAEQRSAVAERGLSRARDFSLVTMLDSYEELLMRVCSTAADLKAAT